MKRRQFLKSVFGVVAGLVAVPSVLKAKRDKLTPKAEDGLDNAFCYGGKLFRVYPDYFDKGFVRMRLWENKHEFNHVVTNEEYNNRQYRNRICEYMLAKFDN